MKLTKLEIISICIACLIIGFVIGEFIESLTINPLIPTNDNDHFGYFTITNEPSKAIDLTIDTSKIK